MVKQIYFIIYCFSLFN